MKIKITNNGIEKTEEKINNGSVLKKAELLVGNKAFRIKVHSVSFKTIAERNTAVPNARYAVIAKELGFGLIRNNIAFGSVVINVISGDEEEFFKLLTKMNENYDETLALGFIKNISEKKENGILICREIE